MGGIARGLFFTTSYTKSVKRINHKNSHGPECRCRSNVNLQHVQHIFSSDFRIYRANPHFLDCPKDVSQESLKTAFLRKYLQLQTQQTQLILEGCTGIFVNVSFLNNLSLPFALLACTKPLYYEYCSQKWLLKWNQIDIKAPAACYISQNMKLFAVGYKI